MKTIVSFLSDLEENKALRDAIVTMVVQTGQMYLGSMALLESSALMTKRKGWAKKFRQSDSLSPVMRLWTKSPTDNDKLESGLVAEILKKIKGEQGLW